jgi:2-methylaconitate cis-trans-isomerase PrpF
MTCIDMAMPMMIIEAGQLGKTWGTKSPAELDADKAFLGRLESLRLQAGLAMGLGDVSDKVIPKPVLVSPAKAGGTLQVRYFHAAQLPPGTGDYRLYRLGHRVRQ